MSQGSVSPKREIDNRNLPTTKAATMLGCTPEALMADSVASEGRLGANRVAGVDASSVFQIRQSPSQTPGTVGSNQRTEVAPVPRGTSPTYVPKAGSFSTKIPTHVIQPFVKKEEHVWVPGKFSTSPDGFSGNGSSNVETYASSPLSVSDVSFGTNARDQRGKTQSNILAMGRARLNGMSPDMSAIGISGNSPTMGMRSGKNGGSPPVGRTGTNGGSPLISRRESPVLNGQGPLGPGIFTNKMVAANMRGTEGRSGNSSPYVSGHNSPFISGTTTMSIQSRSYDSNESILDERHRANQLALASHHQLLTRQRSAASLPLHSRVQSGQQQAGQRSPPIPTLLQQRLSQLSQTAAQPTSHLPLSRHHSAPSSPQLFPPNTQLPISQLNMGSSQYVQPPPMPSYPPSQTQPLSSNQSSGFDLEFNGLRNPSKPPGFEAQLPSFLRDL